MGTAGDLPVKGSNAKGRMSVNARVLPAVFRPRVSDMRMDMHVFVAGMVMLMGMNVKPGATPKNQFPAAGRPPAGHRRGDVLQGKSIRNSSESAAITPTPAAWPAPQRRPGQPRAGPRPQRKRSYGRKMVGAGYDVNKSGQDTGKKGHH